jgi:hypothetical protein
MMFAKMFQVIERFCAHARTNYSIRRRGEHRERTLLVAMHIEKTTNQLLYPNETNNSPQPNADKQFIRSHCSRIVVLDGSGRLHSVWATHGR